MYIISSKPQPLIPLQAMIEEAKLNPLATTSLCHKSLALLLSNGALVHCPLWFGSVYDF
jgi:hypothetical protein